MPNYSASLPMWVALPCGVLFLAGITGLVRTTGWAIRLFNPTDNYFTFPATHEKFRFTLSKAGSYEISCTRPGLLNQRFLPPADRFLVQALPDGPRQEVQGSFWSRQRRTSLDGEGTVRIAAFTVAAPGEYELRNPGAAQFQGDDKLRILPDTGSQTLGLILAFLFSGLATIGGLVVGIIALANR